MYRINSLMRGVLITTDEVIFHAPTKQTLDPRTIQNSIIIAEERFIVPALGYALYNDMVTAKNVTVTSSNIASLQLKFQKGTPPANTVTLTEGMVVNAWEQMGADYQNLWVQQLWKLVAECVMVIALPEGFVQFGSEGVVHTAPPAGPMSGEKSVVTPELASMKWALDKKVQGRVDPLVQAMQNWICYQRKTLPSIYPLYTTECPCDDTQATTRKSNIVLGLYDDIDNPYNPCSCYD